MPAVALALDHKESKAAAPFAPADAEEVDDNDGFPSVDAGMPKEGVDLKPGFEEEGVDVDAVGARGTDVK